MEKIVERAKNIILNPRKALSDVKSEQMDITSTMKDYVVYIAAVPAVAMFIGRALVGHPLLGRQNFFRSLIYSVLWYVLALVGVFVFSKIINTLAPNFDSVKNELNAFKLVVYAWTPAFVSGAFNIIPALSILALLGALYGLYLLYLGLPLLMETPPEKALTYTIVSIVSGIILMVIINAIAISIAFGAGGSGYSVF